MSALRVGQHKKTSPDVSLKINPELGYIMSETVKLLKNANMDSYASEVEEMAKDVNRQKFSVAVVGEFSRGKSTFINRMFGRDFLPVSNMPTTAMLTRIRYSAKEAITIYDADKKEKRSMPLSVQAWEKYVADDEGNDPNGVAFVGINSPWLKNGIEIVDTPGAGDLEAKRAALIGDALKSSDSAIITVSAERAMSVSEKLFIEERLISKKTPFLMLVITKLDMIPVSQRNGIVDFVKNKLVMWGMGDIPVYIPCDIDMPDGKYKNIVGMDKVIKQINLWISNSDRKKLTERWLGLKLKSHLHTVANDIREQKTFIEAETDQKKQQLIGQKTEKLEKAESVWKDIIRQMNEKSDECYDMFLKKASEFKANVTEKLQYEVSHTGNIQKWWSDDYPYRLKIEMTNMSTAMENIISRQATKDVMWLNSVLEKNFKTAVVCSVDEIADKESYTQFEIDSELSLEDMSKKRNASKIGITVLSITAALALSSIGIASIIGTMGVGTGGSILTENIFKKKSEEQKEIVKSEILRCTPKVIDKAMMHSEKRIKNIYANIIEEANKQQQTWMSNQKDVIARASESGETDNAGVYNELLKNIDLLQMRIDRQIS